MKEKGAANRAKIKRDTSGRGKNYKKRSMIRDTIRVEGNRVGGDRNNILPKAKDPGWFGHIRPINAVKPPAGFDKMSMGFGVRIDPVL